ncbi:MAG TPA: LysR family transcriptional regulator [Clostridiales bacterium]|nr:LysR family transcriptional regulator [Clostridiales bacterium]
MGIKLDLYRIFCQVAESRSFSKAARDLYMTQPAVSQAISQLESELGLRLFARTPKGVVLTNDGQLLYEHISAAMNLIGIGEKKLLQARGLLVGELRLGVGDTISRYYLLPYLERYHAEHPDIKLRIYNRTTPELCDMLRSGEIDLGIVNLPINEPDFILRECMEVYDIFVCGEKYRRLLDKPLDAHEIAAYPLILLEKKSNSRQYVDGWFHSRGIALIPEIELGSHELLLEFAKINLGIACVIKEFSTDYLQSGILHEVPLKEPIPARSIGCCYLKSVPLSPASDAFVKILYPFKP